MTAKPTPPRSAPADMIGECARSRLGLALGGGAARGWAHIGVLEVLAANSITPDVVCGCSMGALVGAGYVVGQLDALAAWARSLTWRDVLGLLDPALSGGGLIRGERLLRFLREHYIDIDIADSPIPFGAVATDLATGREVWLRSGPLGDAVHASIAVPGVVGPVPLDGRWLVDGGLVNPVPVSLCRAMGADVVIAVNVNSEMPYLRAASRNGTNAGPCRATGRPTSRRCSAASRQPTPRPNPRRPAPPASRACSAPSAAPFTSCRITSPAAAWPASRRT